MKDLDRHSVEEQKRSTERLKGPASSLPQGASIEDLLKVAGTLDDESAREMIEAIEEGCERVDVERPG